jgi:hypothetical protein
VGTYVRIPNNQEKAIRAEFRMGNHPPKLKEELTV